MNLWRSKALALPTIWQSAGFKHVSLVLWYNVAPPQLKPRRPVIDYCKGSHIMAYQYLMDVNGDFTPILMDIFPVNVNGPKHMDVRGDYLPTSGKSPTEKPWRFTSLGHPQQIQWASTPSWSTKCFQPVEKPMRCLWSQVRAMWSWQVLINYVFFLQHGTYKIL